jgi:hypothetical protein
VCSSDLEVLKGHPPFADGYPTTTIVGVSRVIRVKAARFHSHPAVVSRRTGFIFICCVTMSTVNASTVTTKPVQGFLNLLSLTFVGNVTAIFADNFLIKAISSLTFSTVDFFAELFRHFCYLQIIVEVGGIYPSSPSIFTPSRIA